MPKKPQHARPPFLNKAFAEPYSSLARVNVGSFLNKYQKEHGKIDNPRSILPAFLQYLSKKNAELKDLKERDINTQDLTTRGIYDILRAKVDLRKRKPKRSPKAEDYPYHPAMKDHNNTFQRRPPGSEERRARQAIPDQNAADEEMIPAGDISTPHRIPSNTQAAKAPRHQEAHQTREPPKSIYESDESEEDEEEGEEELEELQNPEPQFAKLKAAVHNKLRILKEDEVTWISFDWNANEQYLKVAYNNQAPIE